MIDELAPGLDVYDVGNARICRWMDMRERIMHDVHTDGLLHGSSSGLIRKRGRIRCERPLNHFQAPRLAERDT